ncbi:hypothetical protein ACTFIZ_000248 [Dictyostelium cf. discoideum]
MTHDQMALKLIAKYNNSDENKEISKDVGEEIGKEGEEIGKEGGEEIGKEGGEQGDEEIGKEGGEEINNGKSMTRIIMSNIIKKMNSSPIIEFRFDYEYFQVLINPEHAKYTTFIRKLSHTQKRYSICQNEFLSIIDSLKKFHHLLIGKKVTIFTDH